MRRCSSLVPSPPLLLTKWPQKVVWYLWADSLVLTIPNNSDQSDRCMVTYLPKSRAKLEGDESQATFSSNFCHQRPATRRRYSCIRGGTLFASLPTGAGKSLCFMVPSVEELEAEAQVRKHCKGQTSLFSSYKVENHFTLVVGDGKIEMKLPQRCCEAFVEYLRRAGTELNLKRGIFII